MTQNSLEKDLTMAPSNNLSHLILLGFMLLFIAAMAAKSLHFKAGYSDTDLEKYSELKKNSPELAP